MKKRIIAVQLSNSRGDSALALKQSLEVLGKKNEVILFTPGSDEGGYLDGIRGVRMVPVFYKEHSNLLLSFVLQAVAQVLLFIKLMRFIRKEDTLYINTLQPVGAAWAGRIKGARIIYHLHDYRGGSLPVKMLQTWSVEHTAHEVIFASRHLSGKYRFNNPKVKIIYNSLSQDFVQAARSVAKLNQSGVFTVAMICSIKAQADIYHFLNIAGTFTGIRFVLVLDGPEKDVLSFREDITSIRNCQVLPAQGDLMAIYQQAHLVVNLSDPDGSSETFDMAVLEAMHCGRPVVVPQKGGVAELIEDSVQGFIIDSKDENAVVTAIRILSYNKEYYENMSIAALLRSLKFGREEFCRNITSVFCPGQEVEVYKVPQRAVPLPGAVLCN
jgi:glycosyltransferase involved in cell wall biosynthesis